MPVSARRATIEAQIDSMRRTIESAITELDAKMIELDAFTVTNANLAQDAIDLTRSAAQVAQGVTSKLRLLEVKLQELKGEMPAPFRVPVSRPDVIDALRAAGIDLIVER